MIAALVLVGLGVLLSFLQWYLTRFYDRIDRVDANSGHPLGYEPDAAAADPRRGVPRWVSRLETAAYAFVIGGALGFLYMAF